MKRNDAIHEDIRRNMDGLLNVTDNSIYSLALTTSLSRTTITEISKGAAHFGNLASYVELADAMDVPLYTIFAPQPNEDEDKCPFYLIEVLNTNWKYMDDSQRRIIELVIRDVVHQKKEKGGEKD